MQTRKETNQTKRTTNKIPCSLSLGLSDLCLWHYWRSVQLTCSSLAGYKTICKAIEPALQGPRLLLSFGTLLAMKSTYKLHLKDGIKLANDLSASCLERHFKSCKYMTFKRRRPCIFSVLPACLLSPQHQHLAMTQSFPAAPTFPLF